MMTALEERQSNLEKVLIKMMAVLMSRKGKVKLCSDD